MFLASPGHPLPSFTPHPGRGKGYMEGESSEGCFGMLMPDYYRTLQGDET